MSTPEPSPLFSSLLSATQIAYNLLPAAPQATGMFLDPVDVITGLAILALYDKSGSKGIKLSFLENRVRRDHSYSVLQGIKRAYQGSHDEQLIDLISPIFYGIQWFRPHENKKIKTVFILAQQGIETLKQTYKKEGKEFVATLLHTSHLKLFSEGLSGTAIKEEDFQCDKWDDNPLAQKSHELWTKTFPDRLEQIDAIFKSALEPQTTNLLPDYNVKLVIDVIKDRVDRVVSVLLDFKKSQQDTALSSRKEDQELQFHLDLENQDQRA